MDAGGTWYVLFLNGLAAGELTYCRHLSQTGVEELSDEAGFMYGRMYRRMDFYSVALIAFPGLSLTLASVMPTLTHIKGTFIRSSSTQMSR